MTEGHEDYLGDLWDLLPVDVTDFLENPPTEDEAEKAPTSEWAFDHKANVSVHHTKFTITEHDLVARHGLAVLDPNVCSEAEAAGLISDHKDLVSAHHIKFTAADARDAINDIFGADGKADADIDLDGNDLIGGDIVMPHLGTIGQAAGPLLTFNDTSNFLGLTGSRFGIGINNPSQLLELGGSTNLYAKMTGGVDGKCGFMFENDAGKWELRLMGTSADEFQIRQTIGYRRFVIKVGATHNDLVISADGNIGMSIANSIAAKCHINQLTSDAEIPVLLLDQADVSEEMIEFESTIGVGNAIEAANGKVLTVTHYIKVTIPGPLTRYIAVGTIA